MDINKKIAEELGVKLWQVEAAVALIDEGNTIPFISRYRKEATGALNDEQLRTLDERLKYLRNLEEKKQQVKKLAEACKNYVEVMDHLTVMAQHISIIHLLMLGQLERRCQIVKPMRVRVNLMVNFMYLILQEIVTLISIVLINGLKIIFILVINIRLIMVLN